MEKIIHDFLVNHVYLCALVIFICFCTLLFAMFIDLITGVLKAKARGEARTSTGYKLTCSKAKKYFSTFLSASTLDIITCIFSPFPIFVILWTFYLCFCEFKSVREKTFEKAEIHKQNRTMQVFIENKDEIAKAVVEILKQEEDKA